MCVSVGVRTRSSRSCGGFVKYALWGCCWVDCLTALFRRGLTYGCVLSICCTSLYAVCDCVCVYASVCICARVYCRRIQPPCPVFALRLLILLSPYSDNTVDSDTVPVFPSFFSVFPRNCSSINIAATRFPFCLLKVLHQASTVPILLFLLFFWF